MLLHIPGVLNAAQVAEFRDTLAEAEWVDGNATAGHLSAIAKNNLQLPEGSPVARRLGDMVLDALAANALFVSAALPLKVFPPLFNCYRGGQAFGDHIDNAIRQVPQSPHRIRTDLSATLFLSEPESYEGGELIVESADISRAAKLPAGDMILYPSVSLHRVTPVTRGARLASFFWIQSMVRDEGQRRLLFDLDIAIQNLTRRLGSGEPLLVPLTGTYHNLLRRWAEL